MPVVAWVRYLIIALVLAVIGYIVDTYVPLQPLAHIVAILLYVAAAIAVLYAALTLIRSPGAGV